MSAPSDAADSVLWVERPDLGTLEVTGDDRLTWLNGLLTCDTSQLEVGEGRWGLALTKPGKVVSEVYAIGAPGRVLLAVAPGTLRALAEWLDDFLIMEDAEVADVSAGMSWAMLHGAGAAAIASQVTSEVEGSVHGVLDWSGRGGAALGGPRAASDARREAGRRAGVMVASGDDWERFRILHGIPLYGTDYDAHQNPHEASLERRAVSWDKGCYLGQEAVCMLEMRGKVKRRLVTALVESPSVPVGGQSVTDRDSGEEVGVITSAVLDPSAGGVLALARLRAAYAVPGAVLGVGGAKARVLEAGGTPVVGSPSHGKP